MVWTEVLAVRYWFLHLTRVGNEPIHNTISCITVHTGCTVPTQIQTMHVIYCVQLYIKLDQGYISICSLKGLCHEMDIFLNAYKINPFRIYADGFNIFGKLINVIFNYELFYLLLMKLLTNSKSPAKKPSSEVLKRRFSVKNAYSNRLLS